MNNKDGKHFSFHQSRQILSNNPFPPETSKNKRMRVNGKEEEAAEEKEKETEEYEEAEEKASDPWSSSFSEDILENILRFVNAHKDRNAVSLVCKAWYKVEARTRTRVFIGNCYSVSPERLVERFPRIRSVTLKGKPRFADFDLVPENWGARVHPWIQVFSRSYPFLEELRLKRMTISDDCLSMIAKFFPNFKVLSLTTCDGFSTNGLAMIAACCRELTQLDLTENAVEDSSGAWLSHFPESCTSLVSLNFENLNSAVDFEALERLVNRCKSLRTLKLNKSVTLTQLQRIMSMAPHLVELGTGSFSEEDLGQEDLARLQNSFVNCSALQSLSGFWLVMPGYLSVIHQTCSNLTSLNLSYSPITDRDLASLVECCRKIQRLWLLDSVEDSGLFAVASACKDLRDLRVYPMTREAVGQQGQGVTEEGLSFIAGGCPHLRSILYFCAQMTNAAVVSMANHCRELVSFRLCIMEPYKPDIETGEPMDAGFGAIVQSCQSLTRLSLSGLLTDRAFEYIGCYGKRLERLSVAFAGESNIGLQHVLKGCVSLRKLEIRDSPFGDMALISGIHRYESMRSLWMSACLVSMKGCEWLSTRKPRLNVEVITRPADRDEHVESLYVYRSVVGPRKDMPPFVKRPLME